MDNETALIIEQNRQTHARLDKMAESFDKHVIEDRAVGVLVAKHERYLATSIRALKWAGGTLATAVLAWLGLK